MTGRGIAVGSGAGKATVLQARTESNKKTTRNKAFVFILTP
jgi:hypothetical protein